jgi:SAM-dependent methyltransferase
MSERIDFSANADIYDCRHGDSVPDEGLRRLWQAAGIHEGARVLDVGAGTGRVAIPSAAQGSKVTAIEPAREMLVRLRAKDDAGRVGAVIAEGARLPFSAGLFDVAVVARLLYLTADWRMILREADRVLGAGGVLLHEWSNGQGDEAWVRIREEARRLFEEAGVAAPFHPGVRAESEVDAQLVALRMARVGQVDMGAGPAITLREFLRRLTEGELSYIWNVPEQVRADCLPRLRRWSEQTFDLEVPIPMPRQVQWTIHRKGVG